MSSQPPALNNTVLHIASGDRWGGAEAQVNTLLRQLHADGVWRVRALLLNEAELAQRLREAGIPVTVLPESQLDILRLYRGVAREVGALRPALIHTHRQKENILGALVGWRYGIPSLRTVHGAPEHAPRGWRRPHKRALFALDDWLGRRVQRRVIAVSADLERQLRGRFPGMPLVTIENGIDIEAVRRAAQPPARLAPEEAVSFPVSPVRHIGIVGRLDPVKRVDLFLEMAAELLRAGCADWRFHIFGDGQLRDALEQQARRLGIDGAVCFHGHRQDIAACLAALDALVMCSDHEGLPMTALEAIAVGTPLVAHRVGGLVAVLEGDCGGVLVSDHKPQAYAEAVASLLGGAVEPLLAAGSERLRQRYSAAANAAAMAALYETILAQEKG